MLYNTEMMRLAMALSRHAYAGRTSAKGKLLFLDACASAEACETEQEAVLCLLIKTMEETELTIEKIEQLNLPEAMMEQLRKLKIEKQLPTAVESLIA